MNNNTTAESLKHTESQYNNNRTIREFKDTVLCNYADENISIHVNASLQNGKLIISGYDAGGTVESIWDDDDYEYWYELDQKETLKLLKVINGINDPEESVKREFSGTDGCKKFREICDENGIEYRLIPMCKRR